MDLIILSEITKLTAPNKGSIVRPVHQSNSVKKYLKESITGIVINKKGFQSRANRPFANRSMSYTVKEMVSTGDTGVGGSWIVKIQSDKTCLNFNSWSGGGVGSGVSSTADCMSTTNLIKVYSSSKNMEFLGFLFQFLHN